MHGRIRQTAGRIPEKIKADFVQHILRHMTCQILSSASPCCTAGLADLQDCRYQKWINRQTVLFLSANPNSVISKDLFHKFLLFLLLLIFSQYHRPAAIHLVQLFTAHQTANCRVFYVLSCPESIGCAEQYYQFVIIIVLSKNDHAHNLPYP